MQTRPKITQFPTKRTHIPTRRHRAHFIISGVTVYFGVYVTQWVNRLYLICLFINFLVWRNKTLVTHIAGIPHKNTCSGRRWVSWLAIHLVTRARRAHPLSQWNVCHTRVITERARQRNLSTHCCDVRAFSATGAHARKFQNWRPGLLPFAVMGTRGLFDERKKGVRCVRYACRLKVSNFKLLWLYMQAWINTHSL